MPICIVTANAVDLITQSIKLFLLMSAVVGNEPDF